MLPLFPPLTNSNQAQSHGGLLFDPSLHQSMLSNPTVFSNPQSVPNFNSNISNNSPAIGWPPPQAPNVAMMLHNNQMGVLPQLGGPPLFALNPAAQQLAALQFQAQLQQNLNALAAFQSNNSQQNFNLASFSNVSNGNSNLQNLMVQRNQIGGPVVTSSASTGNPGFGSVLSVATGDSGSTFGKGDMHADSRQNKLNQGANHKNFHPSNSGSPMKRFQDMRHNKHEQNRSQNHRFHKSQHTKHMRNDAGRFTRTGAKGNNYRKEGNPSENSPLAGRKRSYFYTESEIQRWVKARKKNYPTRDKIEKLSQSVSSNKDAIDEAKLRKQQMKEVLAKQAELGVEVAEVPPDYFCETENEDCRQKRNRRGVHGKRPNWRSDASTSSSLGVGKREPTLLQKLLSNEIRGDKNRILQIFRFMTLNNFFDNYPDKPLDFPLMTVKDEGCQNENVASEAQEETNINKAGVGKNDGMQESYVLHEVEKVSEGANSNSMGVADDYRNNGMEDETKDQFEGSEEGELTG